jgi:hypothetical protein
MTDCAVVVPFPLLRRANLIRTQVRFLHNQTPTAAAHNLDKLLEVQRCALLRKQVSPALVEDEIAALREALSRPSARRCAGPDVLSS